VSDLGILQASPAHIRQKVFMSHIQLLIRRAWSKSSGKPARTSNSFPIHASAYFWSSCFVPSQDKNNRFSLLLAPYYRWHYRWRC